MASYVNKHGQAPSPPLPANAPLSVPPKAPPGGRQLKAKHPLLQRQGHEGIDEARCQAPVGDRHGRYTRCIHVASHVIVENEPRDGRIAAMSVCQGHHDLLLRSQGPDYAAITPLPEKVKK